MTISSIDSRTNLDARYFSQESWTQSRKDDTQDTASAAVEKIEADRKSPFESSSVNSRKGMQWGGLVQDVNVVEPTPGIPQSSATQSSAGQVLNTTA
jgi:hypothetical protein